MSRAAQISRIYAIGEPMPMGVEIHAQDCRCKNCDPDAPMTAGDIGKWGLIGLGAGLSFALAYDFPHAARSLLAIVGVGL